MLYIPPPPDDPESGAYSSQAGKGGLSKPNPVYSYPPTNRGASQPKRRFAFLRRKGKGKNGSGADSEKNGKSRGRGKSANAEPTWEDTWEQGDYPFVRLEGNRAACAICLMDFEAPKKVAGMEEKTQGTPDSPTSSQETADGTKKATGEHTTQEVQVDEVTEEERNELGLDELQLDDAGEGPQPLRLLGCHHVFHVSCSFCTAYRTYVS